MFVMHENMLLTVFMFNKEIENLGKLSSLIWQNIRFLIEKSRQ